MNDVEDDLALLEGELDRSLEVFRSLSEADWRRPTRLAPVVEGRSAWTVFELASHHDLFMWLTTVLVGGPEENQAARDAASFYIFPRPEVAPVVYDLAYTRAEGKTSKDLVSTLADTFSTALAEARKTPPHTIGPAYFGPMRMDEFITTRVVESVIHGIDLSTALGQSCQAAPAAITRTAAVLDDLLARRTVPGRPTDLGDDLAWILAASGRTPHPDPRLPLLG